MDAQLAETSYGGTALVVSVCGGGRSLDRTTLWTTLT